MIPETKSTLSGAAVPASQPSLPSSAPFRREDFSFMPLVVRALELLRDPSALGSLAETSSAGDEKETEKDEEAAQAAQAAVLAEMSKLMGKLQDKMDKARRLLSTLRETSVDPVERDRLMRQHEQILDLRKEQLRKYLSLPLFEKLDSFAGVNTVFTASTETASSTADATASPEVAVPVSNMDVDISNSTAPLSAPRTSPAGTKTEDSAPAVAASALLSASEEAPQSAPKQEEEGGVSAMDTS
ncbi:hypothetical protein HK102_012435 [Quaeritorhiza haematococci]|nr:hypothetical protein HK102_012435 [Quaeritorhiza haematococci]